MIHTNLKLEDEKVVCLMQSGAILSQGARDFLLENAAWMRVEEKRRIEIRHPMCHGVIESDLQVQNYLGVGGVLYNAMLHQRNGNGYTSVKFLVRLSDLDEFPKRSKWYKQVEATPHLKRAVAEAIEREIDIQIDPDEIGGEFYASETESQVDPSSN